MAVLGGHGGSLSPVSNKYSIERTSISNRLNDEKKELEHRLEKINKAIDALKRNPEIAEVVNLISGLY